MAVPATTERNTFSIGLIIAFGSWALVFLTLIWGYLVYRMRSPIWLEQYVTGPIEGLALLNTFLIGFSAMSLSWAFSSAVRGGVGAAFILGNMFLIGQWQLWRMLVAKELNWKNSHAGSFIFLLTGFHAVHTIAGLVALVVLYFKWTKYKNAFAGSGIKFFWDFLFYIWVVLFVLVFIVK